MNFGQEAEDAAAEWAVSRLGARVIARGFRCKAGEIDLILEHPGPRGIELVFVEVRARSPLSWISGVESVTAKKRRKISKTIRYFLARYHGPAQTLRFDVMDWNGTGWVYIPNQIL